MSSVREITTETIVNKQPVTANIGQTLSKIRHEMEEHNLRAMPIVDGQKFVGMLGYRELMEKTRGDPSSAKVESVLHNPPEIAEDDNLVTLSGLRINSGRKKFALIGEHNKLAGTVGEREIVYAAEDTEELKNVSVEEVMTPDVITVGEDESHETARHKMQDHNISRLPVVDENENLTGIITSTDLLRAMVPREQMTEGDYKHHKESLSDIPVSEVMQAEETYDAEIIDDASAPVKEAIDRMQRNNKREIIIVSNDKPIGILTLKDIIDHIAGFEEVESIRLELAGPDVPEEREAIREKVETAVRGSLGRVLRRPEELKIHVKKYEKDGNRHKYSLKFKLSSALGVTNIDTHGWILLDAVDEGLDELEKVVKKEKEKMRDEQRKQERKGKYS